MRKKYLGSKGNGLLSRGLVLDTAKKAVSEAGKELILLNIGDKNRL